MHPPPDLAIEIEITSKSIAKQPIYAKLGIKELWRYEGKHIYVLLLDTAAHYRESSTSAIFPFLPIPQFEHFLQRFDVEKEVAVIRSFQQWARTLPS